MMFRPSHPRVMNYRPRFNPQQQSQWRRISEPRAFYGNSNIFRHRPPHISENSHLEHWCETCDRGFLTAKLLEDHKLQHQKCNIDGCQFIAHPNVITKHIQMQHSSGLYKKISNLNNPEEIKKWREERKKNFPTRSNIEKKKAELKEKIDRGEKMGLKQGHRFRDSRPDNKRKLEPNNKSNSKKDFKKKKIYNENKETKDNHKTINVRNSNKYLSPVDDKTKLQPFGGIQLLMLNTQVKDDAEEIQSNLLIDDDDQAVVVKDSHESSNVNKPALCGALVALMCQYGSSDEEENNVSKSNHTPAELRGRNKSNDKSHMIERKENNIVLELTSSCVINSVNDNDSGPEEAKIDKNIEENIHENCQTETVKIVKKSELNKNVKLNKHTHFRKQKSKPPSTLLQKLLFKEVQHERNIVLQCVRYIIKNKYFET